MADHTIFGYDLFETSVHLVLVFGPLAPVECAASVLILKREGALSTNTICTEVG